MSRNRGGSGGSGGEDKGCSEPHVERMELKCVFND